MNALYRALPLVAVLTCPALAPAQTSEPSAAALADRRASFGAFAAPAVLPPGGAAAFGFAGVPEVGAGYRQGLSFLEIDARAKFNYFALSLAAEVHAKYAAWTDGPLQVAPTLGLGLTLNTGARYIDEFNFYYVGARIIPGAVLSYRVAETASVLGELTVPIDVTLHPGGGWRYTPLLGGGGEIYIGEDITAAGLAQFGVDVIKEPLGVPQTRFAFALRVGLGYRFF